LSDVTWWFSSDDGVEETTGDAGGWPNHDAEGRKMFVNTHFRDRAEAVAHFRTSVRIQMRWIAERRERLKRELDRVTAELADLATLVAGFDDDDDATTTPGTRPGKD
jgi:hypothetical protein